ncbi:TlpA disulfide reductase family protein [Nocardioides alcanivorans]|uniref:TlpA disulfide reductase family protein n=1 Tax=Nocardioides alcanivorans TaxID=2897352 RepID=UPI001F45E258|nr:TlpA disulfide reductase family protein [Nocardioides alcanivorans]
MSTSQPGVRRPLASLLARPLALVLTLGLLLSACSGLDGTDGKGYVSGGGTVREVDPGDRGKKVSFTGDAVDGSKLSLEEQRGKVVVMNVWGMWCGECHMEAEDVVDAAVETQGDDVAFLGINVRDASRDNAASYERQYDVPFPSFYDPSGELLLEFHGILSALVVPSTVVLDREGRVAASVIGVLPSKQTLVSIIEKVVAEDD